MEHPQRIAYYRALILLDTPKKVPLKKEQGMSRMSPKNLLKTWRKGGEKEARIEGKKEEEGRKASFSVGSFGSLRLELMFIANMRMFTRCF